MKVYFESELLGMIQLPQLSIPAGNGQNFTVDNTFDLSSNTSVFQDFGKALVLKNVITSAS